MAAYICSIETDAIEFDQEWVILHPDQFTVTKLNESGGLCWSLLKTEQPAERLISELQHQYNITEDEARQDVAEFLEQMITIGLVRHAS
ncbi:PqqD family protein [Paenibacillaceae bacterium]|nr:PqqD family protein [Paenibacillaceae bacterium]